MLRGVYDAHVLCLLCCGCCAVIAVLCRVRCMRSWCASYVAHGSSSGAREALEDPIIYHMLAPRPPGLPTSQVTNHAHAARTRRHRAFDDIRHVYGMRAHPLPRAVVH